MANKVQWFGGAVMILSAMLSTQATAQSPAVYGVGATSCSMFLATYEYMGKPPAQYTTRGRKASLRPPMRFYTGQRRA
jgi:hypothetical protein